MVHEIPTCEVLSNAFAAWKKAHPSLPIMLGFAGNSADDMGRLPDVAHCARSALAAGAHGLMVSGVGCVMDL